MMDVCCERCRTSYRFDEARIPEQGLPVKCSQCGLVFSIYSQTGISRSEEGLWRLRQANGNVFEFKELTTLQRWIVERKVFRDDEISKSGKAWKRLGNIAELATFFQVVDTAAAAMPGTPGAPGLAEPLGQASPPAVPVSPGNPVTPTLPAAGLETLTPTTPQAVPMAQAERFGSQLLSDPSDDDLDDLMPRKNWGLRIAALALVLVVGGGGVALYATKPNLVRGWVNALVGKKAPEAAVKDVQQGFDAMRKDTYEDLRLATTHFARALALKSDYASAKAGLAEAELRLAEYISEEVAELEAQRVQADEELAAELAAEIERRRQQVSTSSKRAEGASKQAAILAPEAVETVRAMAEFHRFNGAAKKAEPFLERARILAPRDSDVSYVLGAAAAEDPALVERAIQYFDLALEIAPHNNRARYKLARVYERQGNTDKALQHADTLLRSTPQHERARALLARLQPPEPPLAEGKQEPRALGFSQLISRATRLREADRASQALRLLQQALDTEPEHPEVHEAYVGLGWSHIDLEQPDAAIRDFEQALDRVPRFSDAHFGLAEAYRMKGMRRDAVKYYRSYLDILPSGPEASVARRMIEMLNR